MAFASRLRRQARTEFMRHWLPVVVVSLFGGGRLLSAGNMGAFYRHLAGVTAKCSVGGHALTGHTDGRGSS